MHNFSCGLFVCGWFWTNASATPNRSVAKASSETWFSQYSKKRGRWPTIPVSTILHNSNNSFERFVIIRKFCTDYLTINRNSTDATESANSDEAAPITSSSSSNLIATIAATEAAIRIASDIIGSTLAHVDDYNETRSNLTSAEQPLGTTSGKCDEKAAKIVVTLKRCNQSVKIKNSILLALVDAANAQLNDTNDGTSNSQSSGSSSNRNDSVTPYNRRDMLEEIGETFNITNMSSINSSLRSSSSYQDHFSDTLDEFRNLTLNNIDDDSSSDENNDAEHPDEINFSDSCSTDNVNTLRC